MISPFSALALIPRSDTVRGPWWLGAHLPGWLSMASIRHRFSAIARVLLSKRHNCEYIFRTHSAYFLQKTYEPFAVCISILYATTLFTWKNCDFCLAVLSGWIFPDYVLFFIYLASSEWLSMHFTAPVTPFLFILSKLPTRWE